MLTLNDIYALPGKPIALTEWVLRADWFPELGSVWQDSSDVLDALAAAGRLTVTELICDNIDGRRYVSMHTLRLDGKPFMVVQNAGREGDDHRKRWVTDKEAFQQALSHLTVHMAETDDEVADLVDPGAPMWVDEVLFFYSTDFSGRFGFEAEAKRTDILMLRACDVFPTADPNQVVVFVKADAPPLADTIRRGGHVYSRLAGLSRSEIQSHNPRVIPMCKEDGYDSVLLYRPAARPATAQEMAAIELV